MAPGASRPRRGNSAQAPKTQVGETRGDTQSAEDSHDTRAPAHATPVGEPSKGGAAIYARERSVALKVWPYLGSKIVIGSLFAIYHAAALVAMKVLVVDSPGITNGDFAMLYVTLFLGVVSGVMWALVISSLTRREEQAMMLVIGLVVLQVVFSGGPRAPLRPRACGVGAWQHH